MWSFGRGHLVIWSFVKIKIGTRQNPQSNIIIYILLFTLNHFYLKIDFDQMTLTTLTALRVCVQPLKKVE